MNKFIFNTLLSNLKKSGINDLSKNSEIVELADIIGIKNINDEDALYDKIIEFISTNKEKIEKHIRCFVDDNRSIADNNENIILLYILYDKYKTEVKGEVSECINKLLKENEDLFKVGKLLNELFSNYHKDYYSLLTQRAYDFMKSIDDKIMIDKKKNSIDEPISHRDKTQRGKNSFIIGILIALVVFELLAFVFYYWKSHSTIVGLENKIQQLEKENKDLSDKNKQLQQQNKKLQQQLDSLKETAKRKIKKPNRKIKRPNRKIEKRDYKTWK